VHLPVLGVACARDHRARARRPCHGKAALSLAAGPATSLLGQMSASGWAPLCVVLGLLASAADSSGGRPGRVLTDEDLETFRRDGVLVVPQLLAPEEVAAARRGLHATLARYGIDHEQWNGSARRLRPLQLTGGKGGIVDVYYDEWAMALRTHPRVFAAMDELWAATWAADGGGAEGFTAPQTPDFVISNSSEARGYAYLDRAVWRLPLPGAGAQGSTQPHLLPHFDQCPLDLFGDRGLVEPPTRWRPIQSSISLRYYRIPAMQPSVLLQ
jgi:hypothetical protein